MNKILSQQEEPRLRKMATASITLGIISIILPYIMVWRGTGINYGSARVFLLGILVAGICGIFGLVFGIKGLKLNRKRLAVVGIIMCTISLLLWIWGLVGWLMMGGPSFL